MALITVCIPAYNAHPLFAKTLRSVLGQTFQDFQVRVHVEPTQRAHICEEIVRSLGDERFHVRRNRELLGWAGNIANLMAEVRTAWFVMLPHDDHWHPNYLERLLDLDRAEPDAMVCYADMLREGQVSGVKSQITDNTSLQHRLLSFFNGGAEADMWRGLTRTEVLKRGHRFPDNDYEGFAADNEWALQLVLEGDCQRVPEALYVKYNHGRSIASVCGRWLVGHSEEWLRAALEHHRLAMLTRLERARLADGPAEIAHLACETAMLRRTTIVALPLPENQPRRAKEIRRGLAVFREEQRRGVVAHLEQALAADARLSAKKR